MRFFVYFHDSLSHSFQGQYQIELYEDNNYATKREFFEDCYPDENYPYDDQYNCFTQICLIDVEVDDKIRCYYFDTYEDPDATCSDTKYNTTYFLGIVDKFYKPSTKSYSKKIKKLLEKNGFKTKSNTLTDRFILMISNEKHVINNIDSEYLILD